jgi:hypothetical protein
MELFSTTPSTRRTQWSDALGLDGDSPGEVMSGDRLIRDTRKASFTSSAVGRSMPLASFIAYANRVGSAMIVGYEDFPAPDQL